MNSEDQKMLAALKAALAMPNSLKNGKNDSTRRSVALLALVGAPDGEQTTRLVKLAIAIVEARGELEELTRELAK